jgi:hypothetical protein
MSTSVQRERAPLWIRVAIVAAMALGSVGAWVANPIMWLWITSRLQSTQPSMGPYLLTIAGITATAIAFGKGLAALNRLYGRVSGSDPTVRVIMPWRRSLRGGRSRRRETDGRLPVTVLDVVMVISVTIAVIALIVWFAVVQPTPPGIQPGGSKS